MNIKPIMNKLKRLLTISLSLAIILTVLPMSTVHVHAAQMEYDTVTINLIQAFDDGHYDSSSKTMTLVEGKLKLTGRCDLYTSRFNIGYGKAAELVAENGWKITKIEAYYMEDGLIAPGWSKSYDSTKGFTNTWSNDSGADSVSFYIMNLSFYRNYGAFVKVKMQREHVHSFTSKTTTSTYLKSAATCTSGAVYYYKCATCNEKGTTTYTSGNALGHNYTVLQSDANQHWYKCSRCTATNTKVNHSGGNATCTSQAVCSTCGKAYGSALGHNYRTTWTYDDTNHWHQCERCGTKKDNGTHSGGTATCTELAKCSTCGKEYGTVSGHSLEHKDAQAAHCSQDGWKEYWECSTCHDVFTNAEGTGTKYTEISWKDGAGKIAKNNDHDWSYAVNGNTITATCSRNTTDHTASISISTIDSTYDGQAFFHTTLSEWTNTSLGLTTPTVNYDGRENTTYNSTTAPTNAGTYAAQITIGEVTASADFTISPLPVTLTWNNTELTYNGNAQKPTATVNEKVGNDVVEVVVTGEQTNANASGETYTATASSLTGTDADNYALPTTKPTRNFTIKPKAIELLTDISVLCGDTNTPTWTGNNFTPTVVIKDGNYTLQNADYTLSGDLTNKHIGIYEIVATGQGNYKGHKTLGWKILPAQHAEGTVYGTAYVGTYNGLDYDNDEGTKYHQISVTAPDNSTIYYYAPDKDGHPVGEHVENIPDTKYSETNPTFVDAGNHIVYFKVVTEGHTTVYDHSVVAIGQRVVKLSWEKTNSLVYVNSTTRQAPTPTITNKVGNDDVSVKDVLGGEIFAGEYTAIADTLQGAKASNYVINADTVNRAVSYTIAKQPVDAPTANLDRFDYNGAQQTYELDTNPLYEILNNTHTDAGTYKVYVDLLDDANYMWSDGTVANKEYSFVINKKPVTAPSEDSTVYTYTGSPQSYNLNSTTDYTISNKTHTNAGSYEVDAALIDPANHMWSGGSANGTSNNAKYTFTINKATVIAPTPSALTFTYDGSEKTTTFTPKNTGDDALYTVSDNKYTNAGSYKAYVVLKDSVKNNYKWSDREVDYVEYDVVINKKTVTIPSVDQTVYTYDGTEKVYSPIVVSTETNLYDILNNKHYNAGTYTVSVVLKDKENYEWNDQEATTAEQKIANRTYTFTINKAKVTKPNENTSEFIFNRNVQTYELATSPLYSISNDMRINAGTQTVTVSLNDKSNYEWDHITSGVKTVDQEYTFEIKPLDISDTATVALDHAYYEFTGLEKVAQISGVTDGTVSIEEGLDFDLSQNVAIGPGPQQLKIAFKGNYTGYKMVDWLIVEDVQHTQDVELPDDEGYVGKLELVVTGDDEVPNIKIDNPIYLLDESDKNLLKHGNENDYYLIELILSLNAYEEELVHEDSLAAIEEVIGNPTGSHYYDISIRKVIKHIVNGQVLHTDIYPITNTEPDEIKITLSMPEEIPSLKAGYSRKYSMIRSHNYGTDANPNYKAEILDVEVKGDEISFTSDKFSDYVLTYKDTLIPRSYKAPNTSVR